MNKLIENTIGTVTGMALGNYNNRQQVKQAGKLQELQIKGQKEMGEFNRQQQMKLFEDTGYGAQRKQMEDAGLNVGLMYGSAGEGGSTATNAGSVGGQAASANSGSEGMGMTVNNAATMAQMELTKAMAEKTKVETAKLAGADTDNTVASTGKMNSEIALNQVKREVEDVNKGLRKIELAHDERTLDFRIQQQKLEVDNQIENIRELRRENKIGDDTVREQIGLLKTNFANAILDGELKQMKMKVDTMTIEKIKTEMSKMIKELEQRDRALDQTDRGLDQSNKSLDQKNRGIVQEDEKIRINRFKIEAEEAAPGLGKIAGKIVNAILLGAFEGGKWKNPYEGATEKK